MPSYRRFSELSPAWQCLLRACQSANYGCIEDLLVKDGEPAFEPGAIVLTDLKLDSEECPRNELASTDFLLSAEIVRLMALLAQIKNGKVSKLEVRAGIPRRVLFEQQISELLGGRRDGR
jgi:hypothetical protein